MQLPQAAGLQLNDTLEGVIKQRIHYFTSLGAAASMEALQSRARKTACSHPLNFWNASHLPYLRLNEGFIRLRLIAINYYPLCRLLRHHHLTLLNYRRIGVQHFAYFWQRTKSWWGFDGVQHLTLQHLHIFVPPAVICYTYTFLTLLQHSCTATEAFSLSDPISELERGQKKLGVTG